LLDNKLFAGVIDESLDARGFGRVKAIFSVLYGFLFGT